MRVLFVTGKLAEPGLRRVLADMAPPFQYDVAALNITVAALMTTSWIASHLQTADGADVGADGEGHQVVGGRVRHGAQAKRQPSLAAGRHINSDRATFADTAGAYVRRAARHRTGDREPLLGAYG